jgi:hypothetical protein
MDIADEHSARVLSWMRVVNDCPSLRCRLPVPLQLEHFTLLTPGMTFLVPLQGG